MQDDDDDPWRWSAAMAAPATGSSSNEYAVGKNGDVFPEGTGRLVKAGTKIRFNMHYHPIGEGRATRARSRWYFYPKGYVPKYYLQSSHTGDTEDLDMPAGVDNIRIGRLLASEPERARHGVPAAPAQPRQSAVHGGDLSRRQAGDAQLRRTTTSSAGTSSTTTPTTLRRSCLPGTILHVISWHNNTASNRYNPDPQNWAGFGQRSIDDMSFAWVNYVWLDRRRLQKQVAERGQADATRRTAQ